MRTRWRARRALLGMLGALGALLLLTGGTTAGATTAPAAPLPSSLLAGTTTWAVLPMGRPPDLANTFWELFAEQVPEGRWRLATPSGVADNGGLVVATPRAGVLLNGFVPSQSLHFTPLISTSDAGRHWQSAVLPDALAPVPDALASGGRSTLALVTGPSAVESGSSALSSWRRLASLSTLAATAAGRSCGLTQLRAVAVAASGGAVVGGDCTRPGAVGVFEQRGGSWQRVAAPLPSALAHAELSVLRLRVSGGTTDALLLATSGAKRWLGGLAESASGRVLVTGIAALHAAEQVTASGTANGGFFALLSGSGAKRAVVLTEGRSPRAFVVPVGTSTLAVSPTGAVQALIGAGSKLTVESHDAAGHWAVRQVITVPLVYGSSS